MGLNWAKAQGGECIGNPRLKSGVIKLNADIGL
jgi:hypothetical protein